MDQETVYSALWLVLSECEQGGDLRLAPAIIELSVKRKERPTLAMTLRFKGLAKANWIPLSKLQLLLRSGTRSYLCHIEVGKELKQPCSEPRGASSAAGDETMPGKVMRLVNILMIKTLLQTMRNSLHLCRAII